jgi:antiviral helicase SKI2
MQAFHEWAQAKNSADSINDILDDQIPRRHIPLSVSELRHGVQEQYLNPPKSLSNHWLDKLQYRWDIPSSPSELLALGSSQTRSIIRFTREGLEGRVTGYKEVTVPASSLTSKDSTSLTRRPTRKADFVRGSTESYPFAPGGLEAVEEAQAFDESYGELAIRSSGAKPVDLSKIIISSEAGLLTVGPGLSRGGKFHRKDPPVGAKDKSEKPVEDDMLSKDVESDDVSQSDPGTVAQFVPAPEADSNSQSDEEIDSLLPVEFPSFEPRSSLKSRRPKALPGKKYAHMVDVNRDFSNFRELVPTMAREWPFELDVFQKEAIYHLEKGESVFVAAHTSAGKTVVAEYAIALAAKHMTKAIYTSPIKALSNQKFRDFKETAGLPDPGILTGDVQINPEASCLIMTTEILRSMLYRGADLIRDVEFVIFDEVHYVNDAERGVVWEEVIIMLPDHVNLILLSATVPNTYEFASWVGRTKKKDIYVISTLKRPVPLEHYLWAGKGLHKIVDADKKFIDSGWKEANDILTGKDKIKAASTSNSTARGRGQVQRGGANQTRGGQQNRGRGQQAQRAAPGGGGFGRGAHGGRNTAAQDRNIWVHLVQYLRKENLLPVCIFVFSKRRCEENADALANLDYCTAQEKSAIHMTIQRSVARLRPEDRQLPQIRRMRELLSRGIAVHHGGLLPIVKEVVEILFARTLVKVLFATETFAMGLNLPTRTVVFSGYRKHDGRSFRDLLPGEYTQMAGRAGRRGLDPVGSVIIVGSNNEAPPVGTLRTMILGDPTKLRSQFRLTYNMILNLLRVEELKIEDMIKRSFSENATQALLPEQESKIKLSREDLLKIKRKPCSLCDPDIEQTVEAAQKYQRLTQEVYLAALATSLGKRAFVPGRLILYRTNEGVRTVGLLMKEGYQSGRSVSFQVLGVDSFRVKPDASDLLPNLPMFEQFLSSLRTDRASFSVVSVALENLDFVSSTVLKVDIDAILQRDSAARQTAQDLLYALFDSWNQSKSKQTEEYDFGKIKDLNFKLLYDERRKESMRAQQGHCLHCPDFPKHFAAAHDEWIIQQHIVQLEHSISTQNLQLLPDYQQRIDVLRDLDFIDENFTIKLKGKVACEIHSADELILTELILENTLAEYEPEEIVALLSAFVFDEKTESPQSLTARLEKAKETLIAISERVNAYQIQHQVIQSTSETNDFTTRPRFGLMEVVYEWSKGMSFNNITDLTDVLEGSIVRTISRLNDTCREVKNAARIIGDPSLFTKMQTCQELIKRDITAVASLYM